MMEKKRELEYFNAEREKSVRRQRDIEEKKEKDRKERDEKRKSFLESVEVAKRAQEEEEIRIKKEQEFENASKLAGNREILYQNSEFQKSSLEKTAFILPN